mgnify:FL=1
MKIYIPAMIRGAVEKGDLDLKMVATPMFPTIPNLKVGQIAIWIEFSDIYMDIKSNSIWGGKEKDRSKNIKKLVDLFSNGTDISQYPPAVAKMSGSKYVYKLVYGFKRFDVLRELGLTGWFFTLLEGDDDALEDANAIENEVPLKATNSEDGLIGYLNNKIKNGRLGNVADITKKDLEIQLEKITKFSRGSPFKQEVIRKVMADNQIVTKFDTLNLSQVKIWMKGDEGKNNSANDGYKTKRIYIGGEFDKKRDMYGWLVNGKGYEKRFLMNAAETYFSTGKKSYIISYFEDPEKVSYNDQVTKFEKTLNDLYKGTFGKFEGKTFKDDDGTEWVSEKFYVQLASIPQDRSINEYKEKSVIWRNSELKVKGQNEDE